MPRCPHCEAVITNLDYTANYTETTYGTSSGTVTLDLDEHTTDESDCDGTDNYEESDYVYSCPACHEEIDDPGTELLPDAPVKKKKVKKFTTNVLGDFPKREGV